PEQVLHRRDRVPLSGSPVARADAARAGTDGRRLPGARLRGMGTRGPHAGCRGPAIPARAEYLAGDDRPLPGADGRPGRGHGLRHARTAHPGRRLAEGHVAPPGAGRRRMRAWRDPRALGRITAGLAACAFLCLVGAAVVWAMDRPVFDLRAVVVEPVDDRPLRYVSATQLEQALKPVVKGSFFSTELESVRERVETVPWVRSARVRRIWPDRLEVRIEEHRPLALWHDGRLVNTYRELFSANLDEAEEDGPLPQLAGPPGSEA